MFEYSIRIGLVRSVIYNFGPKFNMTGTWPGFRSGTFFILHCTTIDWPYSFPIKTVYDPVDCRYILFKIQKNLKLSLKMFGENWPFLGSRRKSSSWNRLDFQISSEFENLLVPMYSFVKNFWQERFSLCLNKCWTRTNLNRHDFNVSNYFWVTSRFRFHSWKWTSLLRWKLDGLESGLAFKRKSIGQKCH